MCYSVIILFVCVVLVCVLFEPFRVVGVCGVVCGDNSKVTGAGTTELLTGLLIGLLIVLLVWMVLWMELWIGGKMRKPSRELYPVKNADFVITF